MSIHIHKTFGWDFFLDNTSYRHIYSKSETTETNAHLRNNEIEEAHSTSHLFQGRPIFLVQYPFSFKCSILLLAMPPPIHQFISQILRILDTLLKTDKQFNC